MSMQSILAASQSTARMQTMQSARAQMQSTANILRIESKQDGGNKKKDAKADALDENSNHLLGDLMGKLADVNETLKPEEDTKVGEVSPEEVSPEEESAKKPPKTDTIQLSDSATKHIGKEAHTKPVVLEAVTYKADGSAEQSAPAKSAPTFDVTA